MQTGVGVGMKIDRGIAPPVARMSMRWPHEEMGVGDSFFVATVKMQVVLNANWRASKRLGWKFVARKEGDGIRVWRMT